MLFEKPVISRSCRFLVVVTLGAALVGCSGAGDTTRKVVKNLNPVNWFGDDEEEKEKKPLQAGKNSPARQSFPRLGDVPSRPKKPTPEEQTQEIAEGLAADTQNAKYSDQQLRQSAAVFGGRGQPQRTIQRSQPVPVARPAVRAPTPRVSRPVAAPSVRPPAPVASPTVRPPQTVRAPQPVRARQPVRAPTPTTQRSAVKAPSSVRIPPPPPPVAPPPLVKRPSAATALRPVAPPRPVAAPPAPKTPRITPPPPVATKPASTERVARTAASARPTLAPPPPPTAARRLATPPPRPVARTPAVAPPPNTQAPTVSRAAVPSASSGFATPVGRPSTQAKPPPVPQPLRGPAGAQTVAVAPPRPVQLSRSEQASRPQATVPKSIQVGTIYFGDGSASLSREDVSIIAAVRQAFGQTGGKIRVVGHSSMGANTLSASRREEVNFRMSLRRANAVAEELIRHGVPRQSVEVIAEGDRAPAYEESSQTGAAYNRRTEIFIDYQERS
ncbi:MAG: hypothetical protein CMM59_09380 [Rhodospirillaceae bacterium]|nr:hypothetical protein [Rhodospirillaceae bacterium]